MPSQKRAVMPIDPELRKRVRVLLAEHDMEQKELASRTGLSETTISGFLSGRKSDVKLSTIESIARVFGCTTEILLKDSNSTA
jgi:DNA-binding Xre family transcriptional regulator